MMWLKNAGLFLFQDNWKWWLAGILLGLTIFAFIWVTGRLFGVSVVTRTCVTCPRPAR
jgi:hypothetical protein